MSDPDNDVDVEVLEWQIGIYLNYLLTIIMTIIFGYIVGNTLLSLLAMMLFVLIRRFSGGVHMSSLTLCAFVSGGLFALITLITLNSELILILNIGNVIIFALFSPNDFENLNPSKIDPYLKFISTAIVFSNFLIASPVICLTFALQAILILPIWKGGEQVETKKRT